MYELKEFELNIYLKIMMYVIVICYLFNIYYYLIYK